MNLRRLELPTDEAGGLYTEPAKAPGPLNWNAAVVASYANRLVVLQDSSGAEVAVPVRHQLSLDYLFGIGLGDRIALGLSLPSVVYQTGSDVSDRVSGSAPLPKSALGDVGLSAKAVLLPSGDLGGFAVAALARVTLPTGDPTSYISDGKATGELRLLSELSLVALTLRATVGAKVRVSIEPIVPVGRKPRPRKLAPAGERPQPAEKAGRARTEQPRPQGVAKKHAARFCMSAARIFCALALPGCSSPGSRL